MYPGLTSYGFIFSGWSLPASYPSLVLVHRHFISLGKQWPHVRFKRLVAGVEHTHPQHSAIHRVRHQLIQGGEVVVARDLAAVSRADGRERGGIAEERVKRLLADADVQAKDQRTVEVRELVIDIAGHKCHKRKPVIRRYVPIRVVEEEAVARSDHHIHTLKCPSDRLADLRFIHGYWSFPDSFALIASLLYNTHAQLEAQTTRSVCDGYRQCHIQAPVPRSQRREQKKNLEKSLKELEGFTWLLISLLTESKRAVSSRGC